MTRLTYGRVLEVRLRPGRLPVLVTAGNIGPATDDDVRRAPEAERHERDRRWRRGAKTDGPVSTDG
jgi:hypothetical protein